MKREGKRREKPKKDEGLFAGWGGEGKEKGKGREGRGGEGNRIIWGGRVGGAKGRNEKRVIFFF